MLWSILENLDREMGKIMGKSKKKRKVKKKKHIKHINAFLNHELSKTTFNPTKNKKNLIGTLYNF